MKVVRLAKEMPRFIFPAIILCISISRISPAQSSGVPGPSLKDRHPRYLLQSQDVIALTFPLSPELNETVTVQPDGYINLQGTENVYVQGLTVPDLSAEVKKAYAGILNNPIVNVDVEDFRKPFFTVSGQVAKPGQYELRSDITVAEALAVAGGMTMMTAKTQVFLFRKTSSNWVEVKKVNLKAILKGKNLNEDLVIMPGDMIYVPEKFIANFKKYVPYTASTGTYVDPATL
jgi:polysaccharide export outer membrane protein